jgi:hypothetical protein
VSAQSVPIVNIVNANVSTNLFDRNFNDPSRDNATFHLGPDERALVTLRAYCAEGVSGCDRSLIASLQNNSALGVVAQSANCTKCTGAGCSGSDLVNGPTECSLSDGPPKDIYDPIGPQIDVLDPDITAPDITVVAVDNGGDGTEPVSVTLNVTDNVAVSSVTCESTTTAITVTQGSGSQFVLSGVFALGTTGVTCVAKDTREPQPNSSSIEFLVDVRDITPIAFANPPFTFTSAPNAFGWYTSSPVIAMASMVNPQSVTIDCSDTLGGTSVAGNLITIAGDGVHNVSCTATKQYVDPVSAGATVRIDTIAPVITVPAAVTVEATSAAGAVATFIVSVTDNLDTTPSLTCSAQSGATFALGATPVTCTAMDDAGNTANHGFVVTVRDTTAPVVTLQGAASMTLQIGAAFVDPGATALDTVSGSLPVSVTGTVNTAVPGTYVLTYTATDAAGNPGSKQRTVIVADTLPPTSFTATVNPTTLWPPNGNVMPVTISGNAFDAGTGVARIEWRVLDEYKQYEPTGTYQLSGNGPFSFQIGLLNARRGNDKDGRHYTITMTVFDAAGNQLALPTPLVVNIHDQSGQ